MVKSLNSKKLVFLNIFSGAGKVIITASIALISIPLSLDYWGQNQYGFIVLINSILVYLNSSSLGIDAAAGILMNKGKHNDEKWGVFIRSFKMMSLSVFAFLMLFILLVKFYPNWMLFFSSEMTEINQGMQSATILIFLFILNLFFKMFTSGFHGFHKPYIESIFQISLVIVNFLVLIFIILFKLSLLNYAYMLGCANLFLSMLKTIVFYRVVNPRDNISKDFIDKCKIRNYEILKLGFFCFIATTVSMVINNVDSMIIAKYLGLENVATYSVTFKIYTIAFAVLYVLNSSIIPLIGAASGKGDLGLVKETYYKTLFALLPLLGVVVFSVNFFIQDFLFYWSGLSVSSSLIITLSIFTILFSITNINNIIINALGYIPYAVGILFIEGVVNVIVSIHLSKYFGVVGVALGTVISMLMCSFIFFPLIIYYQSNKIISFPITTFVKYLFLLFSFFILSIFPMIYNINFLTKSLLFIGLVAFYYLVVLWFFPQSRLKEAQVFVVNKLYKRAI